MPDSYKTVDNETFIVQTGSAPSTIRHIIWQGLPGVYLAAADGGLLKTVDFGNHWAYVRPASAQTGTYTSTNITWPGGALGRQVAFSVGPKVCAPSGNERVAWGIQWLNDTLYVSLGVAPGYPLFANQPTVVGYESFSGFGTIGDVVTTWTYTFDSSYLIGGTGPSLGGGGTEYLYILNSSAPFTSDPGIEVIRIYQENGFPSYSSGTYSSTPIYTGDGYPTYLGPSLPICVESDTGAIWAENDLGPVHTYSTIRLRKWAADGTVLVTELFLDEGTDYISGAYQPVGLAAFDGFLIVVDLNANASAGVGNPSDFCRIQVYNGTTLDTRFDILARAPGAVCILLPFGGDPAIAVNTFGEFYGDTTNNLQVVIYDYAGTEATRFTAGDGAFTPESDYSIYAITTDSNSESMYILINGPLGVPSHIAIHSRSGDFVRNITVTA